MRFVVQRLDGYTDGKPSWLSFRLKWRTREAADAYMAELQAKAPNQKMRVRKITRKP